MNTPSKIDKEKAPETAKFQAWVDSERGQGLEDVKFYCSATEGSTVEDVCREANAIVSAKSVEDNELF